MRNKLKGETEEGAGEVRALLSHADVHAGIGAVEGADQETSIRVYDAIIQPDLRDRQKHVNGCLHFFVCFSPKQWIYQNDTSFVPAKLFTHIYFHAWFVSKVHWTW